jgi:Arc/MetJ-type ribon-helix-helix transcriptional regulator
MAKALELAIAKASQLPEATQESIGRELLERLDQLAALRAEIEIGLRELDDGKGRELDIEEVIAQIRAAHGKS